METATIKQLQDAYRALEEPTPWLVGQTRKYPIIIHEYQVCDRNRLPSKEPRGKTLTFICKELIPGGRYEWVFEGTVIMTDKEL